MSNQEVKLWESRDERISGFSKGMLQRLGLGIMLYYPSDILILDSMKSSLYPKLVHWKLRSYKRATSRNNFPGMNKT